MSPSLKQNKTKHKEGWRCSSVVLYLPSVHKTVDQSPEQGEGGTADRSPYFSRDSSHEIIPIYTTFFLLCGAALIASISSQTRAPPSCLPASYREALATIEGHFPRQISLLRPPGAVDLGVSDHHLLIQTGIQVKSNVHPRAKVDVKPGMGSSHRPCLSTEF